MSFSFVLVMDSLSGKDEGHMRPWNPEPNIYSSDWWSGTEGFFMAAPDVWWSLAPAVANT